MAVPGRGTRLVRPLPMLRAPAMEQARHMPRARLAERVPRPMRRVREVHDQRVVHRMARAEHVPRPGMAQVLLAQVSMAVPRGVAGVRARLSALTSVE